MVFFLVVLLLLVAGIGWWGRGPGRRAALLPPGEQAAADSVVYLEIDAGPWRSDEEFFAWRPGMTVIDLLLKSSHEAEVGGGAFVTAIGGVRNGPGRAGWQYWVNGEYGQVGAGSRRLEPRDHVLWKHAPYN